MSVEIASWQTRCSECGEVYGDTHMREEEARERDADAGGMCTDCLMAFNRQPAEETPVRETLEQRLAKRRKPGDPDYDAFYDGTDGEVAGMVHNSIGTGFLGAGVDLGESATGGSLASGDAR